MITTVTTTTVTTVTTMVASFGIALGLAAVLALVAFLCAKEFSGVGGGAHHRFLTRSFNLAIVPLIIVFGVIVVMEVLRLSG